MLGNAKGVEPQWKKRRKKFDCTEEGEIKEYVGCKIVYKQMEMILKITQLVHIQSFEDEFTMPGAIIQ